MDARTTAVRAGLVAAGLALAAYPALRPYGPETGATGAADLASPAWLWSHTLAVAGFVLLAFVLRSAVTSDPWAWHGQPVRRAESRMWLAVALLLPYYGAESFGLTAVAQHAVEHGDPGVLDVADAFRYAPVPVTTFALGLGALALVGGRLVAGLWRGGGVGRAGGLLAGLGLVTYLPQFFAAPGVRVLHGLVLGLGLVLLALAADGRRVGQTADQERSQMVWGEASSAARTAAGTGSGTSVTT